MSAGVVTVGRRAYAVGLYWENSPSGRVAQTAKEAAKQPGQQAEFYAVRPGNNEGRVPQFGLGQLAAGHKSGMPSFAACLANQQPGSWVGAFKAREGVVVAVVRDELIVPDGDLLFSNETEARDRVLQEMSFGGLQKVYAPEAWAIPGSDTMPVALLMDERRDITLRPVSIPKKLIIGVAGGVALLLVLVGGFWYWQVLEDQAKQEAERQEQLRRAQEAARNLLPSALQNKQPEYPPPVRFWEDRPQPLQVVEACRAGLQKVTLAVAGWRMGALTCNGSAISTSWGREHGPSAPPVGSVVDAGASNASMVIPLTPLTPRGHEDLVNPDDVTHRYLGQNWPGVISRIPDDPPPPPPPGYQGPWNPPPPPWVKRSFTVSVRELPSSLPTYWRDLPGLIVNSMSYTPSPVGGTWTIEGVIYENRI